MAKVTDELVRTKSEEIRKEMDMEKNDHSKSEIFSGKKDLLHLLLKSNMDPSLKPSERMSQELCRSQIQFFLCEFSKSKDQFLDAGSYPPFSPWDFIMHADSDSICLIFQILLTSSVAGMSQVRKSIFLFLFADSYSHFELSALGLADRILQDMKLQVSW